MRILTVVSTFYPHFYGGGEVAATNLSQLLARHGHEVGILTSAEADEPELRGETLLGFKVWRLRFPRPYVFWKHAKASRWMKPLWYLQDHFDPRNRRLMAQALDAFKPDLVAIHVVSGIGYNSLREIAARKIPAVYFLHDLNLACFSGGMFKDGKICEKQCTKCKLVSHVRFGHVTSIPHVAFCSPSQANLDKAASVLPLKSYQTAAIFNPNTYPAATVARTESGQVRFLYVGRLHKTKGIDLLLSALEQLSEKHNFTINILGEGAEGESLRQRFGHHAWCHFRGHVSEVDVSNYMQQSDALCIPSIWAEPLGGVVVHAFSMGLPVLGSKIGGIPELIQHQKNGLLIPANDLEAWKQALNDVLNRPDELKMLAANVKTDQARFDAELNGQKIIHFFTQVAATASAQTHDAP